MNICFIPDLKLLQAAYVFRINLQQPPTSGRIKQTKQRVISNHHNDIKNLLQTEIFASINAKF